MSKNYDYTAKERMARARERMKAQGFKRKEVYVHDDDWPDVKEYAQKKLEKRLKNPKKT